jgi:subtilisin family serine protease
LRSLSEVSYAAIAKTPVEHIAHDRSVVLSLSPQEVAALAGSLDVEDIEVDGRVWALRDTNDPLLSQQPSLQDGAGISVSSAWDVTTGVRSALVAIIDSGADLNHSDLRESIWRNGKEKARNGRDDDGNGYVDDVYGYDFINKDGTPQDDNGHGTHVAGIVAAVGNNSNGIAGVAWSSKVVVVKALNNEGEGRVSTVIKAIDYVTDLKARGVPIAVMNLSLGGKVDSPALYRAVERARNHDIVLVAAAGNSGSDNDSLPLYPANFPLDSVVSVAATGLDGALSSFSNFGANSVHLGAPGSAVLSTAWRGLGFEYRLLSGTSMASPHVAGVLALVAAANPALSFLQARNVMLGATRSMTKLQGVTRTGGIVDAGAAVRAALATQALPRIFGYVRGAKGQPLAASVTLRSRDGQTFDQTVVVAKDGSFFFSEVPLGNYTLSARAPRKRFRPFTLRATTGRLIRKSFDAGVGRVIDFSSRP